MKVVTTVVVESLSHAKKLISTATNEPNDNSPIVKNAFYHRSRDRAIPPGPKAKSFYNQLTSKQRGINLGCIHDRQQ